ncbi:Uncharacterised protein [Klebsiella pneumoniae]|nr:Uncharacterised protein [Klebsiella pneumoniae]
MLVNPFGIFSFCSCNFSLRLRVLNAKMQRTKQGDISFCQRLEILPATSERHPPSANNEIALPKEFALEEGVILNSYYQIWIATRVRPYFIKEGACFQLATRHSFFSARLTWLSNALNNRCRPPFLADGDWVIAARRHGYDDLQALYNVSDGSVYLKNSPFHPGNQQMASIYKIAYGLVLIVMFFTLTIKLHDPMLNLGSWPFYREMLTRLTGTLLPINLLLIVMEFVRMIAHPLSRRVAGRVKVHQAILRYARRQGARMTPWELK